VLRASTGCWKKAVGAWEDKLGQIRVAGGTDKQQAIFYTALYHSLLMPTVFSDVNGDYLGFDGQVHRAAGFRFYTDMSLWRFEMGLQKSLIATITQYVGARATHTLEMSPPTGRSLTKILV
jgi:hypothetical protein